MLHKKGIVGGIPASEKKRMIEFKLFPRTQGLAGFHAGGYQEESR